MNKLRSKFHFILLIIISLGLFLRVMSSLYGLPQQLNPDEQIFVNAAGKMLSDQSLDPQWYGAPASTLITSLAFIYSLIAFSGLLVGNFESLNDFKDLWFEDKTVFLLSGRIITAFFGSLCIIATYKLAKSFVSKPLALIASSIVAFSPLMVEYSSIIRMDMFQIFFMLLVAIYAIKIIDFPKEYIRNFAISGTFLGLAVTSKYPGVIAVLAVLIATSLATELSIKEKLMGLFVSAFFSLFSAFISAPYLFINFHEMLNHVLIEARPYHLSGTSPGFLMGVLKYLKTALPLSTNMIISLLGYIGLLLICCRRKKELIVFSLFFGYLFFISALDLWWKRWSLPLIPLLAIAFAITLQKLTSILTDNSSHGDWKRSVALGLFSIMVLPLFLSSAYSSWNKYNNSDTRVQSLEWVYKNIPKGSRILLESYAPQLPSNDYEILFANYGKISSWRERRRNLRPSGYFGNIGHALEGLNKHQLDKELADSGVEYVIISNFHDRFKAEEELHIEEVRVYESIIHSSKELALFEGSEEVLGNPVRIYQLK